MKVFFTCSTKSISEHAKYYREIRNQIIALGHTINRDWIDYSINVAERGIPDIPSFALYKDVMSAILTADSVVVDSTVRSMSLGHQITYALQKDKTVLLMKYEKKGEKTKKLFIEGSDSENLITAEYKKIMDIKKILKRYFDKFEEKSIKRFNLAMTGAGDNYINWASFNYKKTKTEIIQEGIDKMIEKDITYKKYLSRQS
jgi:hypothetical protein